MSSLTSLLRKEMSLSTLVQNLSILASLSAKDLSIAFLTAAIVGRKVLIKGIGFSYELSIKLKTNTHLGVNSDTS